MCASSFLLAVLTPTTRLDCTPKVCKQKFDVVYLDYWRQLVKGLEQLSGGIRRAERSRVVHAFHVLFVVFDRQPGSEISSPAWLRDQLASLARRSARQLGSGDPLL